MRCTTSYASLQLDREVNSNYVTATLSEGPAALVRGSVPVRTLVQDFQPIYSTMECLFAQRYWRESGVKPFIEDQVPFAINNDGSLSAKAAAVLLAHFIKTRPQGALFVLEIGAGIGLHARYLLDAFRDLCHQAEHDFYDRLTFFVTDISPTTVRHWASCGIFDEHRGHVVLATAHGQDLRTAHGLDDALLSLPPLNAIFANYVLDILPATVVRRVGEQWQELQVQTWLGPELVQDGDAVLFSPPLDAAPLTREQQRRAARLMNSFEFETKFMPFAGSPAFAEHLSHLPDRTPALINFGAFQCLQNCLTLLAPHGVVLLNDYSARPSDQRTTLPGADRFGPTLAYGLDFPLLDTVFTSLGFSVAAPENEDNVPIHSRLLSRERFAETESSFNFQFHSAAYRRAEQLIAQARRDLQAGALSAALASYAAYLEERPRDWQTIGEVAELLCGTLGNHEAALELGRAALAINPWFSASLWNIVGDALFGLNRFKEAHQAFQQALRLEPHDARTHFNLSFTFFSMGEPADALRSLATALGADRRGSYRERILSKQAEILQSIALEQAGAQAAAERRAYLLHQVRLDQ